SALCGLGQTGPNPVLSTIRHFRSEYDAHVKYKKCPAGVCEALIESPCSNACPAGLDTHGYIALISQGRFREAYDLIVERMPFPGVCGRVCTHVCESKCRRGDLDDPVAIRLLKRFVSDYMLETNSKSPVLSSFANPKDAKVAIIGAGPAGLTAAYHLARLGYPVTVFEASNVLGGMMAIGIPAYRLPRDILKMEIDNILSLGVKVETNRQLGRDFTISDLFKSGYKAIFVSIGAWATRTIGIPGENLENVYQGINYLADVNLGRITELKGQVVVIGGGNVAVDAARTAIRLGADKVQVIYRRRKEEMPASIEEVEEAEKEGVVFNYLVNPVRILGDEAEHPDGIPRRAKEIVCVRMALGEFDTSGRRTPAPIPGTEFSIPVDAVILATGQFIDAEKLRENGLKLTRQSTIEVDPDTLETNIRGVFAGGDCVSGPATVVEAISSGIKAAESIDRFLGGKGVIPQNVRKNSRIEDIYFDLEAEVKEEPRVPCKYLPLNKRCRNFSETELGYSTDDAVREATRCLHCDRKIVEET
ncbi:MAG: FAD-dependent oxidoreductase, partial [Candidatus Bathyarchaeia archaeon]